jgi:hypothetical protein
MINVRSRHRSGSVLLLVVLSLFVVAIAVGAAIDEATASATGARARYDRACLVLAARGGVHLTVGHLASFEPDVVAGLERLPKVEELTEHREDKPVGWFVARRAYPAGDAENGIEAEEGRMPLSALTTGAARVLFGTGAIQQQYREYVATRRALAEAAKAAARTSAQSGPIEFFRNPLELFVLKDLTRGMLMGQDWNDNAVLEDFEDGGSDHPANGPVPANGGPNRGLMDIVTGATTRFNPYVAAPGTREIFLADADPELLSRIERRVKERPAPASLDPGNPAWLQLCANMTADIHYFRIKSFGTRGGQPCVRTECVVEYLKNEEGDRKAPGLFRVADWREAQ